MKHRYYGGGYFGDLLFKLDVVKLQAMNIKIEKMPIAELEWQFDTPLFRAKHDGIYDLTPRAVIEHLKTCKRHYGYIRHADKRQPVDVTLYDNKWVVVEGLNQLMRRAYKNKSSVKVRKIPTSAVMVIH